MDDILEMLNEEELWEEELKSNRIRSAERAAIGKERSDRYPNRAISVPNFDRLGRIRRTASLRCPWAIKINE